jgi:lysophospholipase L1-like esterase
MKTLQIIFITIAALAGCTKPAAVVMSQTNVMTTDTTNKGNPGTYTYLALGDSYTIGQSVSQAESFPYKLATALTGVRDTVNAPTIIATTGWTTQNLIDAIASSNIHEKTYDFVTLLIGVNDQYQGLSQTTYANNFAILLNQAIGFAKGDTSRVFVLSIPDYGVTPYAAGEDATIGPQIDAFNAINLQISTQAHVHYLNITGISREAATNPSLIADDGLHPSAKMYALWIAQLAPMVEARLKK